MTSNCCKAPIIENTDICSQCKEHCLVLEKPTDTNIAKFFGYDRTTLWNYKNSKKEEVRRRYEALKREFIRLH